MKVFDRILNKEVSLFDIETPIILGRYLFMSEDGNALLNDSKINKGDFLVPCISNEGRISIDSNKKKLLFQENELLNQDVNSLIKHTLLEASEELEIIDDLSDLKDINILLRNFDERLEKNEFEQFLKKELLHIEIVCREPSYYLKREITKLHVARAKRIPVKAINYLAAHTEDWSRRRIRAVEPRKILAETIEYDLQIYENQITASLIDKLLIYFSHRMVNEIEVIDGFISKIEEIIESRKRTNPDKVLYWYKKLIRDYDKLGKAVDSIEKSRIKIERIKDFISSIQMRLFALLKSDLYMANSKTKKKYSQKLKRTNLFDNHQHYRFVKILWERYHNKKIIDCPPKSSENQKTIKSYIDYSWIIIFRALFTIGFNKITTISKNIVEITNELMEDIVIQINRNENQTIEITFNNDNKIIFIPVPSTKENINIFPQKTLSIFYFSLYGTDTIDRGDILKISPIDINSEEKILTIIFEVVFSIYLNNYLFKLDSQKISKFKVLKNWLKNNNSLILEKGQKGKIDFWLKRKLNQHEITELNNVISKQKQDLSPSLDIRSEQLTELKQIEDELKSNATKHFEKYETCISCSVRNSSNLITDYNGGFKYKCNKRGCEVEYGYTQKGIFYKVPNYDKITKNLSKINNKLNNKILLNAFGYENV